MEVREGGATACGRYCRWCEWQLEPHWDEHTALLVSGCRLEPDVDSATVSSFTDCLPVSLTVYLSHWHTSCVTDCRAADGRARAQDKMILSVFSGLVLGSVTTQVSPSLTLSLSVCIPACTPEASFIKIDFLAAFPPRSTQNHSSLELMSKKLKGSSGASTTSVWTPWRWGVSVTVMNLCLCFLSNSVLMVQNKLVCGCRLLKMEVVMREWISVPGS